MLAQLPHGDCPAGPIPVEQSLFPALLRGCRSSLNSCLRPQSFCAVLPLPVSILSSSKGMSLLLIPDYLIIPIYVVRFFPAFPSVATSFSAQAPLHEVTPPLSTTCFRVPFPPFRSFNCKASKDTFKWVLLSTLTDKMWGCLDKGFGPLRANLSTGV